MAAAAGGNNSSKLRRTGKSGEMTTDSSEPLNTTRAIVSSAPTRLLGRTCPLNIVSELTLVAICGLWLSTLEKIVDGLAYILECFGIVM